MPRRPTEPRYFPSRKGYYVQIGRKQILLAKGREGDPQVVRAAWELFHAQMAVAGTLVDGDKSSVYAVFEKYLEWLKNNRSENSYRQRSKFLQSFSNKHGAVKVKDLKKLHVEEWLAEHHEFRKNPRNQKRVRWGATTRRIAIACVVSALNWAVDRGYITKNPVARMKKPQAASRGGWCLVTDAQHEVLMDYLRCRKSRGFADALQALYDTGARPGEVIFIEARHYNPKLVAWVIDATNNVQGQNKLAYTGRRRVIYLTPELQQKVERLNAEHPSGPIFRNDRGKPYTDHTFECRFGNIRRRLNRRAELAGLEKPFIDGVSLYGYRHRFVTDWLEAGKPVGYLADLLGTSISMIQRHYSHLAEKTEAMRNELLSFNRRGREAAKGEVSSPDAATPSSDA